jgi:hypothetical protein
MSTPVASPPEHGCVAYTVNGLDIYPEEMPATITGTFSGMHGRVTINDVVVPGMLMRRGWVVLRADGSFY